MLHSTRDHRHLTPPRRRPRTEYADTCLEKWEGRGGRATDRPLGKRTKNLRLFSSELEHVDGWDGGGGGGETPATDFPYPYVLYCERTRGKCVTHRPTARRLPPPQLKRASTCAYGRTNGVLLATTTTSAYGASGGKTGRTSAAAKTVPWFPPSGPKGPAV